MKRLLLFFIITFTFSIMNAQETYRFRIDTPEGFSVESSTSIGLSLHYSISELVIADIDNSEAKGQEIILKGCFGSFAEGLPNLPFENRYIAVPKGATVSVEVKERGCKTFNGIDLLPVAHVQGNAAVGMPKIQKDMNVFGKDTNFPSENVRIAQTTQIRGLDVVLLNVTPFRYNPMRKTLEVIYDMDIEVRFEGGDGQFGEARYRNPAWDQILRDMVINSNMLPEAHYYDILNEAIQNREEGCEYLIISPDDDSIVALADTLRKFRNKQGILTKVVTTTECGGNDANVIKNYIQNAYEHWTIPPAAVMIFGGVDSLFVGTNLYEISSGIPGFGLIFKEYDNGYTLTDYHYSSDNPYADMNGDSIPDLALSRLPAMTLNEYQTQVNKLIQYENNPPTQPNYYDQPIITSSYEFNKWFLITSQSVNGFYRDKLGLHPKNYYMLYEYTSDEISFPDTAWSTGYNTAAVVDYFGPNGQNYIAQQPDTLSNWRDMFDNSYLIDALNKSSFLTMYRDHSSYNLWCSPWLYSDEIMNLNYTEPTFLLSIGCDAALYANFLFYEYSDSYFSYGEKPMIYEFCKANIGALGGIGAATVTHSHFNEILTCCILDNFWPTFMPDLGTMTRPEFTRPAYALVAGKLFLNEHVFLPDWWPEKVTATQNDFHYLGETYLNLYTEVPQQMAVEANPFSNSQIQYTLTAEEGATICLSREDEILYIAQATGQSQTFDLPHLPIGEQFTVTVTKQNRFRFERKVTVISPDLPFVYLNTTTLNDQDNNGQLDFGEYATLDISLYNQSEFNSDNGEITLLCESPYIEILQGTAHYSQIAANTSVILKDAFKFKLANNVPDQAVIRFKVRFNENENTHEDGFRLTANAPVVKINPEFRPLTSDGEPSTHISTEGKSYITFSINNIGHSNVDYLCSTLNIKAPFVDVETPPYIYENLAPNENTSFTYELNTSYNTISGAWLQSQLDVQYGEYNARLDTIIQFGGVFEDFEDETLNPFFLWTNSGSNKWEYCTEDVFEGQRCIVSQADTTSTSTIKARLKAPHTYHNCMVSFHYKTDNNESLKYYNTSLNNSISFSSDEWQYAEAIYNGIDIQFVWSYKKQDINSAQAKIDDICFPPLHTTIAYAGDKTITCDKASVVIQNAYAYDYDVVRWTTDGDGHFEDEAIVNPTYFPGSQDLANKNVILTLTALGKDTIVSSTQIQFLDEINVGNIAGDNIVNKYEQRVSHYIIDYQEGMNYFWQLEPAEAGYIYNYGNAVDILWNLHEGDAEVTLIVTAENGCEVEPVHKKIRLIGTDITEWNGFDFNLFPNPTDGKVNLVMSGNLQSKAVVEVYNLWGERMLNQTISQLHQGETISLDLSKMVSGLYVIKLNTENGSCSKKVSVR